MEQFQKPLILFDTDMDTDCDDAGALGMLFEYVSAGRAHCIGIAADVPDPCPATVCEMISNWYGIHPPIGTIYEKDFPPGSSQRYQRYHDHRKTLPDEIYYNRVFARLIGKRDKDYPSAAEVYRKALASAPDGSVTVLAVGFFTAIEQLWLTPADKISELNGYDLFARKVRCVVSMGCADYPETDNYNFNYNMDRFGAKVFFDRCPCSVYVCPDGFDVITGATFSDTFPIGHPLRTAYEIYNGPGKGRMSWDLISLLFALEPDSPLFECRTHGTIVYDDTNNHVRWNEQGSRKDYEVHSLIPSDEMAQLLENRLHGIFD